ncbi:winged helix-turn-helix domain-containing protein [Xanthomarina sp. GH4-25]|uniref:winged helix-turn-helix domain-containing protein n=1 Tax=Xanthomarina sp. GH4-25 TaxID=3349335 RepID=UPI003877992D
MNKSSTSILSGIIIIIISLWFLNDSKDTDKMFDERVKVSLRSVGNQLLLINQDTTSLILPIIALEENKYQLSFQKPLSFEPEQLVSIINASFQKAKLPSNYLVETVQCEAQEVAYSYQVLNTIENSIVPCVGRILPESCYTIEVLFTDLKLSSNKPIVFYALLICGFIVLILGVYKKKKILESVPEDFATLGNFKFYPEQNKLVMQAKEISLSKKECELLEIFVANPNQIIKRDELTKKVWEDHGVFVGRSLDTYISKLRKKLEADRTIKITNVHGVGYKLEMNN